MEKHWHEILGFFLLVLYFVISSWTKKKQKPLPLKGRAYAPRREEPPQKVASIQVEKKLPPEMVVASEPLNKQTSTQFKKMLAHSDLKRAILLKEILARPKSEVFEE